MGAPRDREPGASSATHPAAAPLRPLSTSSARRRLRVALRLFARHREAINKLWITGDKPVNTRCCGFGC